MSGVPVNFLNPKNIFDQLALSPGDRVADFGAGAGHFTLEAARRVGDTGVVYAIDVLASALESIESSARVSGLGNISCVRANLEKEQGSKISQDTIDCVIAKDVLFQNQDKESILKEAHRVLKPEGIFLVIEWNEGNRTIGPDVSLRVDEKKLQEMIEKSGFSIEKNLSAGDYHYAFLAKKNT